MGRPLDQIWYEYTPEQEDLPYTQELTGKTVICNRCNARITNARPSKLKRHSKSCRRKVEGLSAMTTSDQPITPSNQPRIDSMLPRAISTQEKKKMIEVLVELIACFNLPFSMWESKMAEKFCNTWRHDSFRVIPNRKILANDELKKVALKTRQKVWPKMQALITNQQGHASLIIDGWRTISKERVLGTIVVTKPHKVSLISI